MTVKLAAPTFLAPVTYKIPGDNGQPLEIQFQARYKRLPKSERELLDKRLNRTALAKRLSETFVEQMREAIEKAIAALGDTVEPITDLQLTQLVLRGWELRDAEGVPVPYDEGTVAAVLEEWDGMDTAIAMGFFNAMNPKAAEKNSVKPSPTTSGQTAQTNTSSTQN